MIQALLTPQQWTSLWRPILYRIRNVIQLPTSTNAYTIEYSPTESVPFSEDYIYYLTSANNRQGYITIGDVVTLTKGVNAPVFKVVAFSGQYWIMKQLDRLGETIPTSYDSLEVLKTTQLKIKVYSGYRKEGSGQSTFKEIGSFLVDANDQFFYEFDIQGYVSKTIGEVGFPTTNDRDTSLYCHYYITASEEGSSIEQDVDSIKYAINGALEAIPSTKYFTKQKPLSDLIVKSNWLECVYSIINDDIVSNVYLEASYVPVPETPGGGGNVTIRRVNGTIIQVVTAPDDYVVANSNAVIKDENNNTLKTIPIQAASGNNSIVVNSSVVNIKNSDESINDTINILPESITDYAIPDTPIQLKDSSGVNIGAPVNKPSGVVSDIVVDDATLTLNGAAWRNVKAEESANVALVDENDIPITPVAASPSTIKINQNTSSLSIFNYANYQ